MNINKEIIKFSEFLNQCVDSVLSLTRDIETKNENIDLADKIENGFYQFGWEIFIEAKLCNGMDSITPYGDGADFYGRSCRVTYPERFANYKINVVVSNKLDYLSEKIFEDKRLDFNKLVSFNKEGYSIGKPFNFVLCDDDSGRKFVFKLKDVDLILVKI